MVLLLVVLCCLGSTEIVSAGVNAWTGIGPEGTQVTSLAIDPTAQIILYAANYNGGGVFKTTNGGGSWSSVNVGLTNTNVTELAIDPRTPTTLYAGTNGSGVFKSMDAGGSWRAINDGLTDSVVTALAVNPQTPSTIYVGTGSGVFKTTDGGNRWSSTGLMDRSITALILNPRTPTILYAGTASFDLQCLCSSGGLWKSDDGGGSWRGGESEGGAPFALAIDPQTPTILYVAIPVSLEQACAGPGCLRGGLFKIIDEGDKWGSSTNVLLETIYTLAIDPSKPSNVYAGTDAPNYVFKSTDGGSSWSAFNTGLAQPVLSLAIDPQNPTIVYAGTYGGGVFVANSAAGSSGLTVTPSTATAGGGIDVAWTGIATPTSTDWIGLYTPGAPDTVFLAWSYVSCTQTPGAARAAGACPFLIPAGLAPGDYELRLLANNGFTRLASASFTVTATGPLLSVSPGSVSAGGSVTATWSGIAAPTPTDWIGLYIPGAADTAVLAWTYVSCTQTPGSARAAGACALVIPPGLVPGVYELRLLANNVFTPIAITGVLTVTPPTALTVSTPMVTAGGGMDVAWTGIATPTSTDWIGLYTPGAPDTAFLAAWSYVSCTQTPGAARAAGACPFVIPAGLAPGTYELRLLANNVFTRRATSALFTVTATGPLLSVSLGAVNAVTATWNGIAAPTSTDWIGLYTPGTADTAFLAWTYVSCTQTPGSATAAGACAFVIPPGLVPGVYELRLLANNVFTRLATSGALMVGP